MKQRKQRDRTRGERHSAVKYEEMKRKQGRNSRWDPENPSREGRGEPRRGSRDAGQGGGGGEKRVMWRDLALESGGWFIKCSKVQGEKVRMDLTCLRRR